MKWASSVGRELRLVVRSERTLRILITHITKTRIDVRFGDCRFDTLATGNGTMRLIELVGKYLGRHLDAPPVILDRPGETILPVSPEDWPEDLLERFDERAGIMQFDGGLYEWEAERCAEEEVRGWAGASWPPSATEDAPTEEC